MYTETINEYFAACNGFSGFKSYFREVFDRKKFTKVYILKGGPGTGKSTLMKKVRKAFESKFKCETILCSSDPNSLDGLIIESKEKRFAIIDGTPPHEEDTRYPGAIDEIINLGEAFNEHELSTRKKEIIFLCETKAKHYRSAYSFLELSGFVFKKRFDITKSAYVGSDDSLIFDIIQDIPKKRHGRNERIALLSSFSKNGFQSINTNVSDVITVTGSYDSQYIFLYRLYRLISSQNIDFTIVYSPFSNELIEGIFIPDFNKLFIKGENGKSVINTTRFLDEDILKTNEAILNRYKEIESELQLLAKDEFKQASDAHFSLEDIYTQNVDFEIVDKITESIINEIKIKINS